MSSILVAPPAERREVLSWLLSAGGAEPDRALMGQWLNRAADNPDIARGLLVACQGSRWSGAVLATVNAGRLGTITAPRVADGAGELLSPLVAAALDYVQRHGAQVAQALLPLRHVAEEAFAAAGFRCARLLLLGCTPDALPRAVELSPLCFDPYGDEAQLVSIVAATYERTLDCDWMNGWREVRDVLESSRATGEHDPRLWYVVAHEDAPVGCLLLSDHPAGDAMELVYMGLLPAFRGRGWGRAIIAQAQRACRAAGRSRLLLFVDAENWPARNAYLSAGFAEWDERRCYLRRLEPVARSTRFPP